MSEVKICQSCGHPIPSDDVAPLMRGKQRAIYEAVRDAGSLGISMERVMQKIYAGHRAATDGGALGNVVSSQVVHINQKIRPFGFIIRGDHGPNSLYRLIDISQQTDLNEEIIARYMAETYNGGSWSNDYTFEQRNVHRIRARELMRLAAYAEATSRKA